ncbi:ATP synthase F1 subunit gamma [Candidatus Gottesmanbacteria bacterium]|nr:ATP synthase F1 subunit gamma [Candidatus Gottesmanbacteria bacterium]
MASIKIIRRRIKSAQNIAQITKAMEMVAASKMKKAQEAAEKNRAYAQKIYEATVELAKKTDRKSNPLLSLGNPSGKTLIILISTNKGLAGGLNTNLFREVDRWFTKDKNVEFVSIGKKGQNFIVKSGRVLVADFSDKIPFLENVPPVTQLLVGGFLQGTYKEVYVIYNAFMNALKQIPDKKQILPLETFGGNKTEGADEKIEEEKFANFTIEPSVEEVLSALLPHYLENQIRAAIYESEASEHSARMIAMKNATDAAFDLSHQLTLVYNKIRQEKITYEIADTVTARMALE